MSNESIGCPHCGKSLKVPTKLLGRRVKCLACQGKIQLPDLSAKPSPPPLPMASPSQEQHVAKNARHGSMDNQSHEHYGFANYGKYAQYTNARNWKAICELNKVKLDSFGTKKELKVLADYLEDEEVVFALTSGIMKQTATSNASDLGLNTWLVALTSERFLFLDCALLTKSVDTQSIRHDRVQAVSASQGWVLGKIQVDLGARTVVIDNCQKATVSVIADLANKWLRTLQNRNAKQPSSSGDAIKMSPVDELEKLANLHSIGALTDDEFSAAKAKLLNSM